MTDNSNNSITFNYIHPSDQVESIISGTIGFIGTFGNGFLICMILNGIISRQPFEWLLLNMALLDMMLNFNYLFLETIFIKYHETIGCRIAGLIDYACAQGGFMMPAVVAVNRYMSLYNNQRCAQIFKVRNVILMCIAIWLLSFFIYFPYYITGNTGLDNLGICGVTISILAAIFTTFPAVCSCYTVSIYCGYRVIRKLKEHKCHGGIHSRLIDETKELTTLVALLLLIPLVTQLPTVIVKFVQMFVLLDPWISRLVTSIYPTTSACNPYLTIYTIKKYRGQVKKWFCRQAVQPTSNASNGSTGTPRNIND